MADPSENQSGPRGAPDASGETPLEDGKRRGSGVVVAVLIALGVASSIYLLAKPEPSRVPSMPRAVIGDRDVAAAMSALEDRARGFVPRGADEERVERLFLEINRAELADASGGGERGKGAREEFRRFASAVRMSDHERFLRMGEHLALQFHDALADVLEEARSGGLDEVLAAGGERVQRLRDLGGNFMRLEERGLFARDGAMNASPLLPQVLFRKRWCALAGARGMEEFDGTEQRVMNDFVIAFSAPEALDNRLAAIERLEEAEPGFDGVIARALVFHQAGSDEGARGVLEEAIRLGREDSAALAFLGYLDEKIAQKE